MNIGFALILGESLFEAIIQMENQIHSQAKFHNSLSNENNLPHTTIFQGCFSDYVPYVAIAKQLASYYKKEVESYRKETGLNYCPTFSFVDYVEKGWYFYECIKNSVLQNLHDFTCTKVKPYLVLKPERMEQDTSFLSPMQIQGLEKYGYIYSGEAFRPHVTIGRADGFDETILKILNVKSESLPKQVPFTRLTVYEMGPDGTHKNTLFEIELLKK